VTLASLFVVQMLTKPKPEQRIPGPARGDLVLEKDALPDVIGAWRCTQFQAALPPEQLPEGQFWWTHSWMYSSSEFTAYVAFDQADWDGWHELTTCYQAAGWTLSERSIVETNMVQWPVVVAVLQKMTGEKATLVFSLFDQDGSLVPSPYFGIPPKKINPSERPLAEGLVDRLKEHSQKNSSFVRPKTYTKIMQCQCLLQHSGDLAIHDLEELIALHLETCASFRAAWLTHLSEVSGTSRQSKSNAESGIAHP
jgi:hypothetical protein